MPKVKEQHSKLLSDGDKIQVMNTSISSSNVSSSTSSLARVSLKKKSKSNASSKLSQNDASPVWPFSSSSNLLKNDNNNNNSQNISNSEENSLVTSSPLESLGSSTNSRTKSLKLSGTKEKNNTNRKSNRKFHQLFPSVSINETVIDSKFFLV